MPKGGARNKSGPARDLDSGRTERLKILLTDLPAAGFDGNPPEFPLPKLARYVVEYTEDGKPYREFDQGATDAFRDREVSIWHELWMQPQAVAWEREPWRWLAIANLCRSQAVFEADPEKTASLMAQMQRLRDDHGLTSAGMRFLGWAIKHDEVGKRRGGPVGVVHDDEDDERDRLAGS